MVQETKAQTQMSRNPPSATAMRVADLSANADHSFDLRPDVAEQAVIAAELEVSALRKLRFEGRLTPLGATDWQLSAQLGATVVQPCVVTLEPVTTRIDVQVSRQFVRDLPDIDAPEVEMPEDDTVEALGQWIDPAEVMKEALTLAVPDYPRAEGAALGQVLHTKPGEKPMTDEDARPFAGLADLKSQLENDKD